MEPKSVSPEKRDRESMNELVKFADYLDPDLKTNVTQLLIQSISKIPVEPIRIQGKRLSPIVLAANVLPQNARIRVKESLEKRVGEEGAPSKAELEELQELINMHADRAMKQFDGWTCLEKLRIWHTLKNGREAGLSDKNILKCWSKGNKDATMRLFSDSEADPRKFMDTILSKLDRRSIQKLQRRRVVDQEFSRAIATKNTVEAETRLQTETRAESVELPKNADSKSQTVESEILHCVDRRELLTKGAVKRLASGEWDGKPFVVQILDTTPISMAVMSPENESELIVITDGQFKTAVLLSPDLEPIVKSWRGRVDDFPVINIEGCLYDQVPRTKLLTQTPMLTKISEVHVGSAPAPLDTPVLWSGSFEWTPFEGTEKIYSRTCSLTVPWSKFKDYRDINPSGSWHKHFAIHFLYPPIQGCDFPTKLFLHAVQLGRPVFFVFDEDDPILLHLMTRAPAFVFMGKKKGTRTLFLMEYKGEKSVEAIALRTRYDTATQVIASGLAEGLDEFVDEVGVEIAQTLATEGVAHTSTEMTRLRHHEDLLVCMQQLLLLEINEPALPIPKDLEMIPTIQMLNREIYVQELKHIEWFDQKRYQSLIELYQCSETPDALERPTCKCLHQPERCLIGILMNGHRFSVRRPEDDPSDVVDSSFFQFDEEKRSKLCEIFQKPEKARNEYFLHEEHLWDNGSPVNTMELILSLVSEDFLAEFRKIFNDVFRDSEEDDVRHFLFGRLSEAFEEICDSEKKSKIDSAKLRTVQTLRALRIKPVSSSAEFLTSWGIKVSHSSDPKLIDFLIEIGLEDFSLANSFSGRTLMHQAAFSENRFLLSRVIDMFSCRGLSIDAPNDRNMTAFFEKITAEDLRDSKRTRDVLEDLLAAGADPLSTREGNVTCLHHAVEAQMKQNIKFMLDMGFVVIRQRNRGKKGEVVDIAGKLAKGTLKKLLREERVHFRVNWCECCRRYKSNEEFLIASPHLEGKAPPRAMCKDCQKLKTEKKGNAFFEAKKAEWNSLDKDQQEMLMSSTTAEELHTNLAKTGFLHADLEPLLFDLDLTSATAMLIETLAMLGCDFQVSHDDIHTYFVTTPMASLINIHCTHSEPNREEEISKSDIENNSFEMEEDQAGAVADSPEDDGQKQTLGERRSSTDRPGTENLGDSNSQLSCRYEPCIEHVRDITKRDKCYMTASCRDACCVTFHRSCWDSFKGDVSTKALLSHETVCMTPDCHAIICNVKTYDLEGNLKSENAVEGEEKTKKKRSTALVGNSTVEEKLKDKFKRTGRKLTLKEDSYECTSSEVRSQEKSSTAADTESVPSPTPGIQQLQKQVLLPAISPEAFLNIPDDQLIELRKREEDDVVLKGKSKKKKKKSKSHSASASHDIHFNLYPDSVTNAGENAVGIPVQLPSSATLFEKSNGMNGLSLSQNEEVEGEPLLSLVGEVNVQRSSTMPKIEKPTPLEFGLRLVESYVKHHNGKVEAAALAKTIDSWDNDVKEGLNFPLFLATLKNDPLRRVDVVKKDDRDFVVINGFDIHVLELNNCIDKRMIAIDGDQVNTHAAEKSTISFHVGESDQSDGLTKLSMTDENDNFIPRLPEKGFEGLDNDTREQPNESDRLNARMDEQQANIAALLAKMQIQGALIEQQRINSEKQDAKIHAQDARIQAQDARMRLQDARIDQQNDVISVLMEDCQKLRDENQKLLTKLNVDVNVKRCSVAVDSEDEICSFCRENLHLQPTIVLPRCGHSFHRSCFSKYKEVRCPLCRTPTEEEFPPLSFSSVFP